MTAFKQVNVVGTKETPEDIRNMVIFSSCILNLGTGGRAEEMMPCTTLYLMPTDKGLEIGLHIDSPGTPDQNVVMVFLVPGSSCEPDQGFNFVGDFSLEDFKRNFDSQTTPFALSTIHPDNTVTMDIIQ